MLLGSRYVMVMRRSVWCWEAEFVSHEGSGLVGRGSRCSSELDCHSKRRLQPAHCSLGAAPLVRENPGVHVHGPRDADRTADAAGVSQLSWCRGSCVHASLRGLTRQGMREEGGKERECIVRLSCGLIAPVVPEEFVCRVFCAQEKKEEETRDAAGRSGRPPVAPGKTRAGETRMPGHAATNPLALQELRSE